jgi:hypothetical protein
MSFAEKIEHAFNAAASQPCRLEKLDGVTIGGPFVYESGVYFTVACDSECAFNGDVLRDELTKLGGFSAAPETRPDGSKLTRFRLVDADGLAHIVLVNFELPE